MSAAKFSLVNDRLPQWKAPKETAELPLNYSQQLSTTLDLASKCTVIPFMSTAARESSEASDKCLRTYDTSVDNSGRYIDGLENERSSKFLVFSQTKQENGSKVKPRLDTVSMRRVLDNTHDIPEDTVARRISSGKVRGALWPRVGRENDTSVSRELGPGHYDVERFYANRFTGDNVLVYSFSDVPRAEVVGPDAGKSGQDIDTSKTKRSPRMWRRLRRKGQAEAKAKAEIEMIAHQLGRLGSSEHHNMSSSGLSTQQSRLLGSLSPNESSKKFDFETSFKDSTTNGRVTTGGTTTGTSESSGISFTRKPRWDDPVYRKEKYTKTTGLLLSPFFDQNFDNKKVPVTLTSGGLQRTAVFDVTSLTTDIDLNPDWGPKASVQAEVRNNPRRLAAVFKSKKEVGFNMPPPTSGTKIGPGSYPGAEIPSIEVKNPKLRSAFFLVPRPYFTAKEATVDSTGELPKFSQTHSSGPFFVMEGKVSAKPIQQWTQRRFKQIYPRHRMAKAAKDH